MATTAIRRTDSSPDRTSDYAEAVVSGEIVAGPHVRNACRRHLADLKRTDGIWFDLDAAEEAFAYFEHVLKENRSVLELIESDYTFLNERLAKHYGVPDVTGTELRLVKLPADSVRGGVLTQGTVLAVTSNPTRTSPVKRGLFILENILGTPPPPPPPDIPALDESQQKADGTPITGLLACLPNLLSAYDQA